MNWKRNLVSRLVLLLSLAGYAQDCKVRVTYYNLSGICADGSRTRNGICAISPDLLHMFPLGTRISVEGYGTYLIADKTARRIRNTVDIWVPKGKRINNGNNVIIKKLNEHNKNTGKVQGKQAKTH